MSCGEDYETKFADFKRHCEMKQQPPFNPRIDNPLREHIDNRIAHFKSLITGYQETGQYIAADAYEVVVLELQAVREKI